MDDASQTCERGSPLDHTLAPDLPGLPFLASIQNPIKPNKSERTSNRGLLQPNESERNRTIFRHSDEKYNKRGTEYYKKVGGPDRQDAYTCTKLDFLDFLDLDSPRIPQLSARTRKPFRDESNFVYPRQSTPSVVKTE